MTQVLVCAHPWKLIQARQEIWNSEAMSNKEPLETIPAVYHCPICKKTKCDGDPEPRVVLGRIEEDSGPV